MFLLRKLTFKPKLCNHHIKGLPFFRQPLVCSVNARVVFFIRFLRFFFMLIWQINLQQAQHKMQLGKEHCSKLLLWKTRTRAVYFGWSNKKSSCWECFGEFMWIKDHSKAQYKWLNHMKRVHIWFPSQPFVYHLLLISLQEFFSQFKLKKLACDCSLSSLQSLRIIKQLKHCKSHPLWRCAECAFQSQAQYVCFSCTAHDLG